MTLGPDRGPTILGNMSDPEHEVAARIAYDHSARRFVEGVGTEVNAQFEAPLDRALLRAYAELAAASGPGPVLDIGCGPGRVAAYLAELGLDAGGVDISPRMVDAARAAHPRLRFEVGSLTALGCGDRTLQGAVYWYSIIATPPSALSAVWAELDRSLSEQGQVLVAFQSGRNEADRRPDAYGSSTELTLYRHAVDDVGQSLNTAGFEVRAEVRRQAELGHESTPQAFLMARRSRG